MNRSTVISSSSTDVITINDLRDYYFENKPITGDQISALKAFDKYKVNKLREYEDDFAFQKQYLDIQIIENTVDYREFLAQIEDNL
ncbi:MAG: hypothetical protein AB8B72_02670 [Crocinitomicaceae bacterium]